MVPTAQADCEVIGRSMSLPAISACMAGGELANGADVAVLGVLGHLAHAHVVEHALAQRRDSGSCDVHGPAPVDERGGLPRSPTSQNQRHNGTPPLWPKRLPRERFSPSTHCCPWPIFRRTTGVPWNLTFDHAAEKVGDRSGPANLNSAISGNSGRRAGPSVVWREGVFDGQEVSAPHPQSGVQAAGGMAAVRDNKTMAELCKEFEVHASRILEWKRQLL